MNIKEIRNYLITNKLDAWVIYDYECTNPSLIGLIGKRMLTRKCYFVFACDEEYVICHKLDEVILADLKLKRYVYKTWIELDELLELKLKKYHNVMMEMTEDGALPGASYVDYGTIMKIKGLGLKVSSSKDLLQYFSARVVGKSLLLQKEACKECLIIKDQAFKLISDTIKEKGAISEFTVQEFIMEEFKKRNMVTDSAPIVAIAKNSKNPHYAPTKEDTAIIKKGDLVLIDLWAKIDDDEAAFGDTTWMGFVGDDIPSKYQAAFEVVRDAIKHTVMFLNEELPKRVVYGYEVDDVCRKYIASYGYGDYFIHRTGHSISIAESSHGKGVNIDNFESHDTRALINNIGFSLEPGIYTDEFGIRVEIDVYIDNNKAICLIPIQEEIIKL